MLIIYDLGLLNGEYVFFTMDILLASCKGQDGRDVEACKAFEGILDVGQYIPDSQDYEDFKTAVYNRMPEMNYTMSFPNQVSTLNSVFYKRWKCTKPQSWHFMKLLITLWVHLLYPKGWNG